jgi:hypothetical protein
MDGGMHGLDGRLWWHSGLVPVVQCSGKKVSTERMREVAVRLSWGVLIRCRSFWSPLAGCECVLFLEAKQGETGRTTDTGSHELSRAAGGGGGGG